MLTHTGRRGNTKTEQDIKSSPKPPRVHDAPASWPYRQQGGAEAETAAAAAEEEGAPDDATVGSVMKVDSVKDLRKEEPVEAAVWVPRCCCRRQRAMLVTSAGSGFAVLVVSDPLSSLSSALKNESGSSSARYSRTMRSVTSAQPLRRQSP